MGQPGFSLNKIRYTECVAYNVLNEKETKTTIESTTYLLS